MGQRGQRATLQHPKAQWATSGNSLTPSASPNMNSSTGEPATGSVNTNASVDNRSSGGPNPSSSSSSSQLSLMSLHVCFSQIYNLNYNFNKKGKSMIFF